MDYKKIPAFWAGTMKDYLFSGNWRILLLAPFHTDRRSLDLQVCARANFQLDSAIFIHFIYRTVDTGNGDDLVAFLQTFLEGFSLLGFLGLGPDHEKIENKDHASEKQQLHHSGIWGGL
jgi:hypothetical protein